MIKTALWDEVGRVAKSIPPNGVMPPYWATMFVLRNLLNLPPPPPGKNKKLEKNLTTLSYYVILRYNLIQGEKYADYNHNYLIQ